MNPGNPTLSPRFQAGRLPEPSGDRYIDSDALFQGGRVVRIRHGDRNYELRHTRNGKLILTK